MSAAASAVRLLVVQLDPLAPVGPLGDWLTEAGAELAVWRMDAGAARPEGPVDGVIVLGGHLGVRIDESTPWSGDLYDVLTDALRDQTPLLCLGLGALALAAAAGGFVARGVEGLELGPQLIAKRSSAATDPLLGVLPITPDVIQWHADVMATLPSGSTLLASSPMYPNQAFRVGLVAWGLQFHVELTRDVLAAWLAADADVLAHYEVDGLLDQADGIYADLAETWAPAAAAFVQVARDPSAVTKPPRIVVETAEPIMDPAAIRAALAAEAHASRAQPGLLPMPEFRRPD